MNWESEIQLPKKNFEGHGYLDKSGNTIIDIDESVVLEKLETSDDVYLISRPGIDTFIIPGSDLQSLRPILNKKKSEVKSNLSLYGTISVITVLVITLIWLSNGEFPDIGGYYIVFTVVLPTLGNLYELLSLNRINDTNYIHECDDARFQFWLGLKKDYTSLILSCILVLIMIIQLYVGLPDSVEAAGLVKEKVRSGEYWRILTAPFLHGNFIHILSNSAALYALGNTVIRVAGLSLFSTTFTISCISGGLASLLLMPDATSVGASGGIMGLVGLMLVFGFKFKDWLPKNIYKSMINAIVFTSILGILAYDVIDNAAHVGGLVGGILVGLFSIKTSSPQIPYQSSIQQMVFAGFCGLISSLSIILTIMSIIK